MAELRYAFGRNWREFVELKLSDAVIGDSVGHMAGFLRSTSLEGKTFLDIGCGSGIHSLAALRLGVERVVSFDYDESSVTTTQRVREWAGIPPARWEIFQGSVLDAAQLKSLGLFDIVYSWGVLHHTGAMWDAVRNAMIPLKPDGEFYIALYSSDMYVDPPPEFWIRVKRAYNHANPLTQKLMELKYASLQGISPQSLKQFEAYGKRGMTFWTDVKDWLGGYPIEFSGLQETRLFCEKEKGLDLVNVDASEGCTEYVFAALKSSKKWKHIDEGRVRRPMSGPFRAQRGFRHDFVDPRLSQTSMKTGEPGRSTVMIFENDKPLGLAHRSQTDVERLGGGRFNHSGDCLMFSTSDNSDPSRNGRTYSWCESY